MLNGRILPITIGNLEDHSRLTAEIQFLFQGRLLQVLHCQEGRDISIGEEGCDFFVPASVLGSASQALLRCSEHGFSFCFSEGAEGRVKLYEGRELNLEKLTEENNLAQLRTIPHKIFCLSLKEIQWARLVLPNGMQFIVRAVPTIKKPRQSTNWDRSLMGYTAGTFVFSSLVMAFIFCVDPEIKSLDISSFETTNLFLNTKIAGINEAKDPGLTEPDQETGDDLPKGVKGNSRGEDEGAQGKKNAPTKRQKFKLSGQAEEIHLAKNKIDDFTSQVGVLALLSGKQDNSSPFASVFGDKAVGKDSDDILGGLLGPHGESDGGFGEGISGTGFSGGLGEKAMGVGKLEVSDAYGRGSGLGVGAGAGGFGGRIGIGSTVTGGSSTNQPTVSSGNVTSVGSGLDADTIRRVIRRAMPGIKYCYEQALLHDEDVNGRIKVHFFIVSNGTVLNADVLDGLGNELEACVVHKISQLAFPAPKDGSVVEVSYPFMFRFATE
jgi:hypothetical protein